MTAPPGRGTATPVGMRDHVLAAMLACAAASGGRLTQARVLALRVDDVPRAVAGLPFGAKVCELVRNLARMVGLSGSDPVAWSRKRGPDGHRRAVSRVQAYRIVRDRTGSGWSGTVRRLVGDSTTVSPPPANPRPAAPASRPEGLRVREALNLWASPPPPHPRR